MLFWLSIIVGVYLLGFLVSGAIATRHLAATNGRCSADWDRQKNYCKRMHPEGCWIDDGSVGSIDVVNGSLIAIVWPIVMFPALVWVLATRTPNVRQREIAVREQERRYKEALRELGMEE